ncbi:MAG TPA: GTPase Era [Acidobacteriaceae bacterium]|nr:GTPase Era [Acidobacteriaceae bacterium]
MRSGFVSILGRPNAGKSTLLNALTGEKIAIVTNKPQTTRTRILGIVEVAARKGKNPAAQIVFVDTPGIHRPETRLDRRMMQEVYEALEHRDIVILMVDATRAAKTKASGERDEDAAALSLLRKVDCPVFLVINKIDLVAKEKLLPLIAELTSLHPFAEVIPISARKKDGLDRLLRKLAEYLPEGQRYFPKDQFTDQPERFLAAELIRERILLETGEEVPYASAVVVEEFEDRFEQEQRSDRHASGLTHIAAAIYCERAGQKAILIGKGGAKLKSIGAAARKEIESLLGRRVYLDLRVIVREKWRDSDRFIDTLSWQRQLEEIAARHPDSGEEKPNAGEESEK